MDVEIAKVLAEKLVSIKWTSIHEVVIRTRDETIQVCSYVCVWGGGVVGVGGYLPSQPLLHCMKELAREGLACKKRSWLDVIIIQFRFSSVGARCHHGKKTILRQARIQCFIL